MRLQERVSRTNYRALRGRELDAIVDGPSPESDFLLQGRLAQQAPEVDGRVLFSDGTARPGDLVRVRVRRTYAFDLVGEIVAVTARAPRRERPLLPSLPVAGGAAGRRA
jgi:ribosomal protein S12 methylthiotransferase